MNEKERVVSNRNVGSIEKGDIGFIKTLDRKNQKARCFFYSSEKEVIMSLEDIDPLFNNKEG